MSELVHQIEPIADIDLVDEDNNSFLSNLSLKKMAAVTLAAAAFAGGAKAEASIEGFSNSPKGVAMEYVDLLSQGKVIEACHLDVNNCLGAKKTDNLSPAIRQLYKKLYTPVSAKVLPHNPYTGLNQNTKGSTLVEVHTSAYKESGQPFCETVKKIGPEWKIVWSGWSTKAHTSCDKPN